MSPTGSCCDDGGWITIADTGGFTTVSFRRFIAEFRPFNFTNGVVMGGTAPNDPNASFCLFVPPASVSGNVSDDMGGALSGVTISIVDAMGDVVNDINGMPLTTTTDGSGDYSFTDVPPGDYFIEETDLAGYISLSDDDSVDDGTDDDDMNTDTNDNSIPISLEGGEDDTGNDFVDVIPGAIEGIVTKDTTLGGDGMGDEPLAGATVIVFVDADNDGIADDNDGIPGPDILQIDTDGDGVPDSPASLVTDATGVFQFLNVPPGDYIIIESNPAGYDDSGESDGSTDNILDINVVSGATTGGLEFIDILASTLPVELLSFTAEKENGNVLLKWTTASEENNEKFVLEYSVGGIEWIEFGELAGAGNSTTIQEYSFMHLDIGASALKNVFYRLQQVDFDGSKDYSSILRVDFDGTTKPVIGVNPVKRGTPLPISGEDIKRIKVIDTFGLVRSVQEFEGDDAVTLNTDNLTSGFYFLQINEKDILKIVIQ